MEQVLFSLIFAGLAYWLIRKAYKTQKIANKGVGKKVGMVCLYLIGAWAATVSISCMGSAFSDDTPEKPKSVTPVATVPEREEITPDGLFLAINDIRRENDLPQFKRNPLLDKSAQLKCDDMVKNNYYDHKNPKTGKSGYDYITDVGLYHNGASENLNQGTFNGNAGVVESWMGSKAHADSILNARYTEIGFAVCEAQGKITVVQHKIAPVKSSAQARKTDPSCKETNIVPYKTTYENSSYLEVGQRNEWGGEDGYTLVCPDTNPVTIPAFDKTVVIGTGPTQADREAAAAAEKAAEERRQIEKQQQALTAENARNAKIQECYNSVRMQGMTEPDAKSFCASNY